MLQIVSNSRESYEEIKLIGQLSTHTREFAEENISSVLRSKNRFIRLDLSKTDWIDSSGLSVLVNSLKLAKRKKGDILLINPKECVISLLQLTKLHEVFDIIEDH